MYLRFGEIPANGKSGIYKGDLGKIGEEIGVSCYRGVIIDDAVYIIMPHIQSTTYYWLLDEYNRGKINLYVIEGEEIGIGTDGEPLLKDPTILQKIIDWKF